MTRLPVEIADKQSIEGRSADLACAGLHRVRVRARVHIRVIDARERSHLGPTFSSRFVLYSFSFSPSRNLPVARAFFNNSRESNADPRYPVEKQLSRLVRSRAGGIDLKYEITTRFDRKYNWSRILIRIVLPYRVRVLCIVKIVSLGIHQRLNRRKQPLL